MVVADLPVLVNIWPSSMPCQPNHHLVFGPMRILVFIYCLLAAAGAFAGDDGMVAWWKFDEGQGRSALDSVTGRRDEIQNNFAWLAGVSGTALKCDGLTTRLVRSAGETPRLEAAFSIEAWIAPQAYPWNWCAIADQQTNHQAGYFFGINETGRVGLQLAVDGQWRECTSTSSVPIMTKWTHVAATFDPDKGITLYMDGQICGQLAAKGKPVFAGNVDLQLARNHEELPMTADLLVRPKVNFPVSCSFDGLIDELKIYNRALTPEEIVLGGQMASLPAPQLQWRKLPRIPGGSKKFGAVYCKLDFYPEWDALWRIGDDADVVVNFDAGAYKMVFWHGTSYNMNLVTENGKWVGDQSAEKSGGGTIGCCEHMSDKQCRYAHVRVIENTDARVVVHWRYALCDVNYKIARKNDASDWGYWADEYYYIYPDGVAVRHCQVHGPPRCSITEPAALNNAGEKPEDNLDLEAVTMANMNGETRTYNWDPWPRKDGHGGDFDNALPNANICVVNFKSQTKPFYIYEPGTGIGPYGGGTVEVREAYSHFPAWNHWPTSQAPSDGHYPVVPDSITSSAVTSPEVKMTRKGNAIEGRFIMGLTDQPAAELAPLARSWLQPPALKFSSPGFSSLGYSRDERAYLLARESGAAEGTPLLLELSATKESPLANPALVIRNWGDGNPELNLNGQPVKRGRDFRFGFRQTLEGTDLIVWLKIASSQPARISLKPLSE
jgi:hypothetical protein